MKISPIINTVTNKVSKPLNKIASTIGSKISSSGGFDKFAKIYEPTGANNSFLGLVTLMFGTVIVPRVITASKRNPDNKEATKDEIKEILFRDLQTVLIILFALKSIDSIVGRLSSKINGLPLTNKAYKNVFHPDAGLKLKDRLKNAFDNIKDTINPVGGMIKYNNKQLVSKYSGLSSIEEIQKLFSEIPKQGGNNKKVFDKIMDAIIEAQEKTMSDVASRATAGYTPTKAQESAAKRILEKLKQAKTDGWEKTLKTENVDKDIASSIVNFFKNPSNKLVEEGEKLSAKLKTFALALEVSYLGFGLPALNQKRLEKKYLGDEENRFKDKFLNSAKDISSGVLVDKVIKPQEIALYHNFIK